MAQNERAGSCWSQPPHLISKKSQPSCRGLGSEDLDDIGDIVNALSHGERRICKSESWQPNKSFPSRGNCQASDCCLKNVLVQCHCLSSQNCHSELQNKNSSYPNVLNRNTLPYVKKSSWSDNVSNRCYQDNKMLEEFILDDNELCLLNYYDIKVPRNHVRNTGKVKTVSIIDTLSELASGATDREDEGGFSSTVSESAVLNRYLHKPRNRPIRPTTSRRETNTFVPHPNAIPKLTETSNLGKRTAFVAPPRIRNESLNYHSQSCYDGSLPCNSLKRTLKCLRKAVASNVVQEECRNHYLSKPEQDKLDDNAFRHCFSDSEVKDSPVHWSPLKHNKIDPTPKVKSKSLLTIADQHFKNYSKSTSFLKSRSKSTVPDWIQDAFTASKKGDLHKLKSSLKNIDPALVRNLSDDNGNNLWHICAVHNNFEGLNWLCTHNPHHTDALKDENKNGFSPAALAIKHGSILAVQWLIHNTKFQLFPQAHSRSLLHIAARYGQCALVEWLLNYISPEDLDANIVDSEGNTALHLAAKYGHINCAKVLIFHIGGLKAKNEHGLKPLDLSVKHGKHDCADFLTAMESCYNLASVNVQQGLDIQHLQKENAEMKSYFRELLTLTKRLQHRQKELVQSFARMNTLQHSNSVDWSNEKNSRYLDDYSQLLATVMTDEEHRLLMVENKWKKSRRQASLPENKKKPLDILRSQFSHVLDKVNTMSSLIPSTPETSDGSWHSDEDLFVPEKTLPDYSAPDVINSLFPEKSVSYTCPKQKFEKNFNPIISPKVNKKVAKCNFTPDSFVLKKNTHPSVSSSNRDVNLRMFFKQNPNLRQSGETCSVLEVLEPSSSEGEECLNYKRKLAKNSEKETDHSSSSSALETLDPYAGRPSSSGSKASGSHSSSSGSKQPYSPPGGSTQVSSSYPISDKSGVPDNSNDIPLENDGSSRNQLALENSFSPEPDLIKGTQKKKMVTSFKVADKEKKASKNIASDSVLTDNLNISTDSESLDADHSFSSMANVPDSLLSAQTNMESANNGTAAKKKGFLFKFALRGRWQNKGSHLALKNEISPQEFRETYSRSALENATPTSQSLSSPDSPARNNCSLPKNDLVSEIVSVEAFEKEIPTSERLNECNVFSKKPTKDNTNQSNPLNRNGLLPARRDPPPAPPISVDEQLQDQSDDDVSINIQKSSLSSCGERLSHNSFLNSRSPDLWHTSDSKSHFRPASSASRVDSSSRGDDNFPLNKSSSASTEMLSALDSSTAGRQSPAPSEISKTESALSPPSDVSKTESTRYLSQLGKIEESGHLVAMKMTNVQSDEQSIKESILLADVKTEIKHKKSKKMNSNKPWYEFSDEEDIIVPQRYQGVSVGIQSSSEDEAVTS